MKQRKIVKDALKIDKMAYAADLKESFRNFYKDKFAHSLDEAFELTLKDLMNDPTLSTFRKTTTYREADQEGKYRQLWRYLVSEFGAKINDEDELSNLCMEIAMNDENQF